MRVNPRIESRKAASQFMDAGGPRLILNVLSHWARSMTLHWMFSGVVRLSGLYSTGGLLFVIVQHCAAKLLLGKQSDNAAVVHHALSALAVAAQFVPARASGCLMVTIRWRWPHLLHFP